MNKLAIFSILLMAGMVCAEDYPSGDAAYLRELRAELPAAGDLPFGDTLDVERLIKSVADPEAATITTIDVEDQPFGRALRVEVHKKTEHPWDVQLWTPNNTQRIRAGDVLLAVFWERTEVAHDESGEGRITAYLQKAAPRWDVLAQATSQSGKRWRRVAMSGVAGRDWAPGSVRLSFHLAPYVQTVELGGVVVLNLGPGVDRSLLPLPETTYDGREPDAPWRSAATERIEQHRKGDLSVVVRDKDGKPVAGMPVRVAMTRHAFQFGCFFDYRVLDDDGKVSDDVNARTYTDWYLRLFSKATTPLYWIPRWNWSKPEVRADYHRRAKWLQEHGLPTRGHNLVWPGKQWLTREVHDLFDKPDELRTLMREHVTEVVEAMKPYDLAQYDVMNEPRVNHVLMDILGDEAMLEWWAAAHETDGRQTLFINEYSIVTGSGHTESEQASYEKTIRYLLDNGAPLGGIGIQGHMGEGMTAPSRVLEILDRLAAFGLPLEITEFDIEIDDEKTQADYTRDFYTAAFSHPAVVGLTQWGFWEGSHWKPRAAMFRKDWTMKPNGQAYIDLVLKKWWTDVEGRTDDQGHFQVRAFCGEYELTVGKSAAAVSKKVSLSNAGAAVEVALPK